MDANIHGADTRAITLFPDRSHDHRSFTLRARSPAKCPHGTGTRGPTAHPQTMGRPAPIQSFFRLGIPAHESKPDSLWRFDLVYPFYWALHKAPTPPQQRDCSRS